MSLFDGTMHEIVGESNTGGEGPGCLVAVVTVGAVMLTFGLLALGLAVLL